jgi:phosphatidate cytidylyltransferase
MSPTLALQSPVFLFYFTLVVGLQILAAVVLAVLKWGFGKNLGHAWSAYLGWLLIVPVLLFVFFLGRIAVIVFLTLVAVAGFREFARAAGLHHDRIVTGAVYLGIAATGVACLMPDPTNGKSGWYDLFMALPILVITAVAAIDIALNRAAGQPPAFPLAVFGYVYFGWMFEHLAFLANSAWAYSYLGYLVMAVALNDVAAYTCGKLFGRHLLRSNISPKKTWEGALGALSVSCVLPWVVHSTLPHFKPQDCLVAGLIVGIGGQVGDLVVSVIKRDLRIKDMGLAIPGHGGILDRIDSLIYVAPLFFHYIRYRDDFTPPG